MVSVAFGRYPVYSAALIRPLATYKKDCPKLDSPNYDHIFDSVYLTYFLNVFLLMLCFLIISEPFMLRSAK